MTNTRFKQRFAFFQRAFLNLNDVKEQENQAFSNLEKEGIIQRFKVLIELLESTQRLPRKRGLYG